MKKKIIYIIFFFNVLHGSFKHLSLEELDDRIHRIEEQLKKKESTFFEKKLAEYKQERQQRSAVLTEEEEKRYLELVDKPTEELTEEEWDEFGILSDKKKIGTAKKEASEPVRQAPPRTPTKIISEKWKEKKRLEALKEISETEEAKVPLLQNPSDNLQENLKELSNQLNELYALLMHGAVY